MYGIERCKKECFEIRMSLLSSPGCAASHIRGTPCLCRYYYLDSRSLLPCPPLALLPIPEDSGTDTGALLSSEPLRRAAVPTLSMLSLTPAVSPHVFFVLMSFVIVAVVVMLLPVCVVPVSISAILASSIIPSVSLTLVVVVRLAMFIDIIALRVTVLVVGALVWLLDNHSRADNKASRVKT